MYNFYLEEPSMKRKEQAIDYVREHLLYKSKINRTGGLNKNYLNYENWLKELELNKKQETCHKSICPGYTYFLIREEDDKLIGMINIRYNLNSTMLIRGGHIGYGIRPTERRKGYNKINLYLGLIKSKEIGLDRVLLTASDNNPASYKTILSLGGILENKIPDDKEDAMMGRYWINVNDSIEKYSNEYKEFIKMNYKNRG